MSIRFTKMHGLGNDFMVIDGINQTIHLQPADIAALSRRDTGVGFDQCLLIEPSLTEGIDFFYRIFNADGQEVGQCGNGARCLLQFAQHYGLTNKQSIRVATHTTEMQLSRNPDQTITVDMGKPRLSPTDIPLHAVTQAISYTLPLDGNNVCQVHAISVGNPHAVMVVTNLAKTAVADLGERISKHPLFPKQTNAGFMEILSPSRIALRVYERGAGETRACGSGAVAAVAIGRLFHQLATRVTVVLHGGELIIDWPNLDGPIFLTGPAEFVYEGTLLCAL